MKKTSPLENICCPHCGKKNTWQQENKERPFCSARCKLIDLGDWSAEKHRIAGEETANSDDLPSEDDNSE